MKISRLLTGLLPALAMLLTMAHPVVRAADDVPAVGVQAQVVACPPDRIRHPDAPRQQHQPVFPRHPTRAIRDFQPRPERPRRPPRSPLFRHRLNLASF